MGHCGPRQGGQKRPGNSAVLLWQRVQLVTTNNIASIPQSYPGSPLRRGSTGTAVNVLQKQLSRIAKDYPSFGKPAITGTFDEATENSVKKFQKQFSLTVDGVVGKATWYKISYIYVSVKDLAELTSEGETFTGARAPGVAGNRAAPRQYRTKRGAGAVLAVQPGAV